MMIGLSSWNVKVAKLSIPRSHIPQCLINLLESVNKMVHYPIYEIASKCQKRINDNNVDFNDSIIDMIYKEVNSIIGLAGWSLTQLNTYEEELNIGLSLYDSAESDINHALQKYKEDNDGKKPQAHKMAKLGYLLDEIRDKHKNIKQCLKYIKVMKDAIAYNYTLEKLKLELTKAKHREYKGRTEFYQIALDILD